ncbi:hypothetical protein J6590_029657 [Homalodisca vitripennis]|nr:hypothetical protein J6590_029657 [Homalodisca vitripennis]
MSGDIVSGESTPAGCSYPPICTGGKETRKFLDNPKIHTSDVCTSGGRRHPVFGIFQRLVVSTEKVTQKLEVSRGH